MSPERLEQKFRALVSELYSPKALPSLHRRFMRVYGSRWRNSEVVALTA
jgi:hypothetical protein